MRSPFRSDAGRRKLQLAACLLLAAEGCGSSAQRPLRPSEPTQDAPTEITGWTLKRPRASAVAAAAADGGTAAHDAGKPASEPAKPAADSGTQPVPQDAGSAPIIEPPAASIVFSAAPLTAGATSTRDSFELKALSELYVYTAWSNLCGEHTELRKYYAPSGELFYQKLTAFSTDITEPVPFTQKVDVPHATSVQPAIANPQGAFVMEDYIGIAGTWIGDHSMTGTWKLELYLDGEKTPTATRSFELTP